VSSDWREVQVSEIGNTLAVTCLKTGHTAVVERRDEGRRFLWHGSTEDGRVLDWREKE
jgi:hypothetical protein